MSDFRYAVLRLIYDLKPFNIKGDAKIDSNASIPVSCIIPTFDRWKDLEIILECLSAQDILKEHFEVIVVEDGVTDAGRRCCARYESLLNIHLLQIENDSHRVGALRNAALENARGNYILFLDDDTRILQQDFLKNLCKRFVLMPEIDCIQISGLADRCLLNNRYGYLDRHSFATRCVAYRRNWLALAGGFFNRLKSYEDIELSIRFIISGGKVYQEEQLQYYHPPLFFNSYAKAITNGLSFLTLFNKYSYFLWIVCYLNAIRFLPLLLSPRTRHRQWGKISAGFAIAPFYRLFKSGEVFYR